MGRAGALVAGRPPGPSADRGSEAAGALVGDADTAVALGPVADISFSTAGFNATPLTVEALVAMRLNALPSRYLAQNR